MEIELTEEFSHGPTPNAPSGSRNKDMQPFQAKK
jgi:hypothetical protein